jgi:adenosylcobinamide-GDP ribazoletransferase
VRAATATTTRPGAAIAYFPVVGVALGAATAALDAALALVLPLPVVAAADLAFLAIASGGLHLDGLADAADGLFSRRDAHVRLAVMRDSRIGAFGAAALMLALLLEFSALSLPPSADRATTIVTAFTLSRAAMAFAVGVYPAARTDGLAARLRASVRTRDVAAAGVMAGTVVGLLAPAPIVALGVAIGVTTGVGAFAVRRIRGLTGDVYGAIGEITFALVLWS